jgi:hypothetical protein
MKNKLETLAEILLMIIVYPILALLIIVFSFIIVAMILIGTTLYLAMYLVVSLVTTVVDAFRFSR